MAATANRTINKLIAYLEKSAQHLDEFRLQVALGKAEARDKFEELKADLKKTVQKARRKAGALRQNAEPLKIKLQELEVQLALGKAETRDMLVAQKKKISKAIRSLENYLRETGFTSDKEAAELKAELEQVKIKLQLIEDKIEGKLGGTKKKDLDHFSAQIKEKLAAVKQKMQKQESPAKAHWGHFTKEMTEALGHVKKAFGQ